MNYVKMVKNEVFVMMTKLKQQGLLVLPFDINADKISRDIIKTIEKGKRKQWTA